MQHQDRLCEVLGVEPPAAAQPGSELWDLVEQALVALLPLPSSLQLEGIGLSLADFLQELHKGMWSELQRHATSNLSDV